MLATDPANSPHTEPSQAPPLVPHDAERAALRLFLGYRITLAAILLTLFFVVGRGGLGSHAPTLFALVAALYMVATVGALVFSLLHFAPPATQALAAMLTDIALFSLLVFASGGVASGLGLPVAVSLTLGSTLIEGRLALAVAALAALAMLGEELFATFYNPFRQTAFMQTGFLGLAFFSLVLLAISFRARAAQRGAGRTTRDRTAQPGPAQRFRHPADAIGRGGGGQRRHRPADKRIRLGSARPAHLQPAPPPALCLPRPCRLLRKLASGPRGEQPELPDQHQRPRPALTVCPARSRRKRRHAHRAGRRVATHRAGTEDETGLAGPPDCRPAHEIRNPLGAISHAAQLLEESPALPDADRRLIQIIRQNSGRVNEVIENILKLSRQKLPRPNPLVLKPWLQETVTTFHSVFGLQPEQISLQVDPEGITVYADEGQLKQILEILCENAIRHFPRNPEDLRILILGGITHESGGPYIEVHDNGGGIDSEAVEKLFDPFFTTHNQGTGLGLYIARQLGEANRIRLEYRPLASGACFRLIFLDPRRQNSG
ncbi:sensor histidine kinase [endosymbiont of unidentified scaly snail isolate Monju]|uniref:sensor histidine kinase n=1 Tax=endosymbiont of unidentified scaly snail isolate Monju TaxID=1248727 RepID=UPI00038922F8|nr:HAMP domain-containing sensor histidine kinase [endosymbiont of unidentified scaly snail isolate Monju]BAN68432.1 sensor kinase [endosymbiont of unidentified scaly snail isolate Monju]